MTSVSWTPRGTVLSMRANKFEQVDAKSSGESANLCDDQHWKHRQWRRSQFHGNISIAGEDALVRISRVVGPHNERILGCA